MKSRSIHQSSRKPILANQTHIRTEKSKVLQRRSLHKHLTEQAIIEKSLHSSPKVFFVTLLACIILLAGVVWFVQSQSNKLAVLSGVDSKSLLDGSVSEETVTINQVSRYKTGATLPRRITIARIGVETLIRPVAAKEDGKPKNPQNINETTWLNSSAKPGEPGVTLIVGYMRGPTKKGVFHDVDALLPGDTIRILRGDSMHFVYKIDSVQTFKKGTLKADQALKLNPDQTSSLHLITSLQEYGIAIEQYEYDYLITAQLVQ